LEDYKRAEAENKKLGRSSQFNLLLCKGLIKMKEEYYNEAYALFIAAQKIMPRNKEIIFYKASAIIMPLLKTLNKEELTLTIIKRNLGQIIDEFTEGINIYYKSDHFLRFYRGLIYLFMQEFDKAIVDFYQAIKNNEEPNPKYHMYIGLTYGCMNLLKEAIKDLSIAIKLKEDYIQAYYNRGKCAYLIENADFAFADFQKLLLLKPVLTVSVTS
jgi:tetratricopeptide (TPR) repeat protein